MDLVMLIAIAITMMAAMVGVLLAYNDKKVGEWYDQSKNKNKKLTE